jgi:hypothetical protein
MGGEDEGLGKRVDDGQKELLDVEKWVLAQEKDGE